MTRAGFAAIATILSIVPALGDCDEVVGKRVASQLSSDFATLVGFTKASCAVTADGQQCSLICLSDLNVVGDNRNLALAMITASAGKRMRDAGLSKFARVTFADRELLSARKALAISAGDASAMQQSIAESGGESPLVVSARVAAAYRTIEIPRTGAKN
ncbi:hypothetical protein ACVWZV_000943 [Bradyrhizobium sp. GM5.1]